MGIQPSVLAYLLALLLLLQLQGYLAREKQFVRISPPL
jgi:hypothetical protein